MTPDVDIFSVGENSHPSRRKIWSKQTAGVRKPGRPHKAEAPKAGQKSILSFFSS